MSWMLRHRGSPQHIDGLSFAQVVEALREGTFDTSDEVRGIGDAAWTVIEQDPRFADIIEGFAPDSVYADESETHIDMNALIDVTLVLLIFFILTTSYQVLEKVLEMPQIKNNDSTAVKTVRAEDVETFMIQVKARQEHGTPKIWIADQEVPETDLEKALRAQASQGRKELILDALDVEYGVVIKIIDAAGGAGIERVHFLATKT